MNPAAIDFPKDNNLSVLRLEQTANGNVVTPWFSFPHDVIMSRTRDEVDYNGYNFQRFKAAAVGAFCTLLDIKTQDVVVSEMNDPSDPIDQRKWRLGTRRPHPLPKPKRVEKPVLPENRGAIDI